MLPKFTDSESKIKWNRAEGLKIQGNSGNFEDDWFVIYLWLYTNTKRVGRLQE